MFFVKVMIFFFYFYDFFFLWGGGGGVLTLEEYNYFNVSSSGKIYSCIW